MGSKETVPVDSRDTLVVLILSSVSLGSQTASTTCHGAINKTFCLLTDASSRNRDRPMWVLPRPVESEMMTPPYLSIILRQKYTHPFEILLVQLGFLFLLQYPLTSIYSIRKESSCTNGSRGKPNLDSSIILINSCLASSVSFNLFAQRADTT